MFKNMNPILKGIIMFVIGCIVFFAVDWLASVIKQTEFTVSWINIIGGGILIAVLDYFFPAEKRKANREKRKDDLRQ